MASVEITNLTKRFGDDTVVRDVDLSVGDGELLVIVGPSGCGKTSLLRMVAGLEEPSDGRILIGGVPVEVVHRNRRTTGMMFQEAALYPHLDVRDNIAFPLRMAGQDRRTAADEVTAIAASLGLTPLLGRLPARLSGGQRQRVAMARALIRRPELLLMDEPMSNLDAKLRSELRATIGHLQRRLGVTTLYVTHDQVEAMALGDRIAVMRTGVIVQVGTPQEIYDRPVDAFVATFVGTPAMNLFVADVDLGHGIARLIVGPSDLPLDRAWHDRLAGWHGRRVAVGIRPQAFRFGAHGAVADVEKIHVVGGRREILATLATPGISVVGAELRITAAHARLDIDLEADDDLDIEMWRASHLAVEPDDIHLFDLDSGRALRRLPVGAAA